MEVTDRVHVVSHGWEVARIVDPIYELKADKVVLILPENEAFMADFEYEMIDDLESTDRLELETRAGNLYNLNSALQVFTQAVKDHEDDDVYINVSTGSQIAAIAGMMAAQTSEATPFYVRPELTEAEGEEIQAPEEPWTTTAGEISELPVFELRGPSPEQLRILGYLYGKDGVTKKELINYAEDEELPFIANTEAESDEGRYRLLESHIVDPLTEKEYVSVEKAGRKKEVHLEERGANALAAFPLDSKTLETLKQSERESDADHPWKNVIGATARHSEKTGHHIADHPPWDQPE